MAYKTFAKTDIVVLNAFEAAAYVNMWCEFNNRELFGESEFSDALDYGIDAGAITQLNDDQFELWSLENVGNVIRYQASYLINADVPYYFVRIYKNDKENKPLESLFSERWRKIRTFTLRFIPKYKD